MAHRAVTTSLKNNKNALTSILLDSVTEVLPHI